MLPLINTFRLIAPSCDIFSGENVLFFRGEYECPRAYIRQYPDVTSAETFHRPRDRDSCLKMYRQKQRQSRLYCRDLVRDALWINCVFPNRLRFAVSGKWVGVSSNLSNRILFTDIGNARRQCTWLSRFLRRRREGILFVNECGTFYFLFFAPGQTV